MNRRGARLAALDEVLDHDCLEVHIDSEWHHHHLPRAVPRSTVIRLWREKKHCVGTDGELIDKSNHHIPMMFEGSSRAYISW